MELLAALSLAAAEPPCHSFEPASAPNQELAGVYLAVAREERQRGARKAALVAYRTARSLDPANSSAREELEELCREPSNPNASFDQAFQRMSIGDNLGAIALFEQARRGHPNPRAALLEGICQYRLADDSSARPLLQEAQRDPELAEEASFYLGLIAHHAGNEAEATTLFQAATESNNAELRREAVVMRKIAGRQGRLTLTAALTARFDSDRGLDPDGAPATLPTTGAPPVLSTSDGAGTGLALLSFTPLGPSGPFARAFGTYRKQASFGSQDYAGLGGAAGWQFSRRGYRLLAEYAYDYSLIGGDPFLSAHQLLGNVRWPIGRFSINAIYLARFQTYLPSGTPTASYSGVRHFGDVWWIWHFTASSLRLGYQGTRTFAQAGHSFTEHGPNAGFKWIFSPSVRLNLSVDYLRRRYEEATQPPARFDEYLDGSIFGEVDIDDHWTLQANVAARKARSNVLLISDFRLSGWIGVSYSMGLF